MRMKIYCSGMADFTNLEEAEIQSRTLARSNHGKRLFGLIVLDQRHDLAFKRVLIARSNRQNCDKFSEDQNHETQSEITQIRELKVEIRP